MLPFWTLRPLWTSAKWIGFPCEVLPLYKPVSPSTLASATPAQTNSAISAKVRPRRIRRIEQPPCRTMGTPLGDGRLERHRRGFNTPFVVLPRIGGRWHTQRPAGQRARQDAKGPTIPQETGF